MVVYKITIEYNGTFFSGFQLQRDSNLLTVQGEIQRVLSAIFNGQIHVYSAGRTDAGVHALGQVIHFESEKNFNTELLHKALDGLLHRAITVKKIEIAPQGFHARYWAIRRKYIYVVDNSRHPSAFHEKRAYWFPHSLDIDRMKEACSHLVGTHDFQMFVKSVKEAKTTIRTLEKAEIFTGKEIEIRSPMEPLVEIFFKPQNLVFFYFQAKSFLRSLVRLMVSNLLEVGRGRLSGEDFKKMLTPDFSVSSPASNIPGYGLYLVDVDYPLEGK